MRIFQPSRISWSYLTRGSEPRSQTKKKKKMQIFATNQISGYQPLFAPDQTEIGHGARQPPRNSVMASADTVITLTYSASCRIANFSDEYSVWYPPTSSPSPSGRSNGSRFVSPTIVTM